MLPASLDRRTDKYSICLLTIFLFTSLGNGRGGVKWERGKVGEENGKGRKVKGMEGREMGMHEKIPQNATYLAFGNAPWGYCPVSYIFRKLFLFTSKICLAFLVCNHLEVIKLQR